MKSRIQFVSGLVVAGLLSGFAMGAAEKVVEAPKDAPKDAPKKEVVQKARSFKGTLAAKPAEAAADVVAVLTVKGKGQDAKETAYNVVAADKAVTDKITELLAKGGDIVIKGIVSEDGKSITAKDAAVAPVKPAGEKGGKGKAEKKQDAGAPALQQ